MFFEIDGKYPARERRINNPKIEVTKATIQSSFNPLTISSEGVNRDNNNSINPKLIRKTEKIKPVGAFFFLAMYQLKVRYLYSSLDI